MQSKRSKANKIMTENVCVNVGECGFSGSFDSLSPCVPLFTLFHNMFFRCLWTLNMKTNRKWGWIPLDSSLNPDACFLSRSRKNDGKCFFDGVGAQLFWLLYIRNEKMFSFLFIVELGRPKSDFILDGVLLGFWGLGIEAWLKFSELLQKGNIKICLKISEDSLRKVMKIRSTFISNVFYNYKCYEPFIKVFSSKQICVREGGKFSELGQHERKNF